MQGFPYRLEQRATQPALIEALSEHLERCLRQRLQAAASSKPLGLATGRTMEPLYAALVRRLSRWPVADLAVLRRSWLSFNLDEYLGLPSVDPRSYRSFMDHHLARPLGLGSTALRLPDGTRDDGDASACDYARDLLQHGGIGIQLLGLGSNGHIGFNEPPSAEDLACRVVTLSKATRHQNAAMFGGDPAAVPAQAITLGLREILAADEIHLVVTGAAKAGILAELLKLPTPDDHLPASWLGRHGQVWLWADADALRHP